MRNSAKVVPFSMTFGRDIDRNAVQHANMMMLGDGHFGIDRGPESVCLDSKVLFCLCKGTIREMKR